MSYFKTDIKKMYKSKLVRYMLTAFLIIMIVDPLLIRLNNLRYKNADSPLNPFMYWILFPTGWGNQIYRALFWLLPVIATGLVFYSEQSSSVMKLSIIRGSWRRYYWSKALSLFLFTFVSFFALFIINILVTYLVFDPDAPRTGQYMFYIPQEGTFVRPFYDAAPIYECVLYAFINALAIALMSLSALAMHAVLKLKNSYIALLVPAVVIYAVQYGFFWFTGFAENIHIGVLTQPIAVSISDYITTSSDVIFAYALLAGVDVVLLLIGYFREREYL